MDGVKMDQMTVSQPAPQYAQDPKRLDNPLDSARVAARDGGGDRREGRRSSLSPLILRLYRLIKHEKTRLPLRKLVLKLEGGEYYSLTIREIFRQFHGVDIGLYTYGPLAAAPGNLRRITSVGRYCSVFPTVRRFNMNHPMNIKSTHPFFYDTLEGWVKNETVPLTTLKIGNDVWIGHNAIIHSTVETIGDGAVIAAGSVVSNNVPPYAVVAGYPARVVRFRFSENTIQRLLEEKWWLKSIDELSKELEDPPRPLEVDGPVR
jgi:virginiamycin A acetyltransferase